MPVSLSVGARHTSSRGPSSARSPRRRSTPVAGSKRPGPSETSPSPATASPPAGAARAGAGVTGSWPQATSCPAVAHGSSAASTARAVSHVSPRVDGQRGQRDLRGLARGHGPDVEHAVRHDHALLLQRPREREVGEVAEVVQVRDRQPARARVTGDPHGLDDLLELDQAGRRRAVGEQEAVGDERAVVQRLAEVAAVREALAAVGQALAQAVVDPLPHEAALAARVALEELLVLRQPAGAVAHGVRVLAEDERQPAAARVERGVLQRLLLAAADGVDLVVRRVHAAVDVDVAARPVVLVVQRPRRVALARPRRHRARGWRRCRSRCRATT